MRVGLLLSHQPGDVAQIPAMQEQRKEGVGQGGEGRGGVEGVGSRAPQGSSPEV